MSDELVTAEQAKAELLAIIDANPNRRNPESDDGSCLYTDPANPDRHCLVGELAARLGWEVPGPDDVFDAEDATDWFHWPITPEALAVLLKAQQAADGELTGVPPYKAQPWRTVREVLVDA